MEDASTMASQQDGEQEQTQAAQHECFLCLLDPARPCSTRQLEGHIVAAYERSINGKSLPFILLSTPHFLASLALTDYYLGFVRELCARGPTITELVLRVYHLPTEPEIAEYKGEPLYRYTGNSYTLAVLEPDILLNITDLAQAHYCSRQYLLNRLVSSPPSAATIRGNLVHYCFNELLKAHDRGHTLARNEFNSLATPLSLLRAYLERGLQQHQLELALTNMPIEEMRAEVVPHLQSLATWYQSQSTTLWDMPSAYVDEQAAVQPREGNKVRAETFLLAPEIGLRGRLDLFWEQAGQQRLLELKTSGATGNLPKPDHRRQVHGYHAQLLVRHNSTLKKALATLLYSGTPREAQAYGISFTLRELQRVNETRNILVLSHATGRPSAPPGPLRCSKCSMRAHCERISSLLDWQVPQTDEGQGGADPCSRSCSTPSGDDHTFFAKYYWLLHSEGRTAEQQLALLWKENVEQRAERGVVIDGLELEKTEATGQGEWLQTFRCVNKSELRKGDEILLSDGDPITGQVVTGTIVAVSAEQVTIWMPELITNPTLLDRYDNNFVHVRTLQNLLRWLEQTEPHLRDLVAGRVRPRFIGVHVPPRPDFNAEQNLAVERALQMQDYLLIQGPPGTGKTSVIAETVKRLVQQGQRVLLAAFTNQAVDNALKRLSDKEDFHDYIRLGHQRSVDESEAVLEQLLKHRLQVALDDPAQTVYDVLLQTPVIASTTATWSSDKYTPLSDTAVAQLPALHFDVAIIDEASQLTVPSLLGALRFAKRFILVGDDKQLPPLVVSPEAAAQGLADSLFSILKRLDDDYVQRHEMVIGACVNLAVQYRMNRWISHFSSQVFYDGKLKAHESVAHRCLEYATDTTNQGAINRTPTPLFISRSIDPTRPLVFLDVSAVHGVDDEMASERAKMSDAEAHVVCAIVQALRARGIKEEEIGIIAPYRAQVANIRHHLCATHGDGVEGAINRTPTVDTVDRFQGGERLVIIMSFATSVEPGPDSQRHAFLTNPNRLNVALTRAQRKLILVGCVHALEHLPIFDRLITYCRSMGTVIAAE
ncbi:MAG: AAA family ATPase [Ktedonobacteraceae bacterium]|nr:AAA family ATPase [Ktedonobacteraceae bacterium]